MREILWSDVQEKHKELATPNHRLRWIVEFAFLDWERLSTGARLDVHAGLLAFVPEMAAWVEDAEGVATSPAWPDEDVQALQLRLQPLFTVIADGEEPVVLTTYPMRLVWYPYYRNPLKPGRLITGMEGPQVRDDEGGIVSIEHEHGLNGVEMAVLYASLLLREYPRNIVRCVSPLPHRLPGICGKIFYGRLDRRWCGPACAIRWRRAVLET